MLLEVSLPYTYVDVLYFRMPLIKHRKNRERTHGGRGHKHKESWKKGRVVRKTVKAKASPGSAAVLGAERRQQLTGLQSNIGWLVGWLVGFLLFIFLLFFFFSIGVWWFLRFQIVCFYHFLPSPAIPKFLPDHPCSLPTQLSALSLTG